MILKLGKLATFGNKALYFEYSMTQSEGESI